MEKIGLLFDERREGLPIPRGLTGNVEWTALAATLEAHSQPVCGEAGCELAQARQPAYLCTKGRVTTRRAPLQSLTLREPWLRTACAAVCLHVWAASALSNPANCQGL